MYWPQWSMHSLDSRLCYSIRCGCRISDVCMDMRERKKMLRKRILGKKGDGVPWQLILIILAVIFLLMSTGLGTKLFASTKKALSCGLTGECKAKCGVGERETIDLTDICSSQKMVCCFSLNSKYDNTPELCKVKGTAAGAPCGTINGKPQVCDTETLSCIDKDDYCKKFPLVPICATPPPTS